MNKREVLKEALKEIVAESRAVRAKMAGVRGMDRWRLWQDKRRVGAQARPLHLARAFLRGTPYRRVERVTDGVHNPLYLVDVSWAAGVPLPEIEAWVAAEGVVEAAGVAA